MLPALPPVQSSEIQEKEKDALPVFIARTKVFAHGSNREQKRDWFRRIPERWVTLLLWFSVGVCGAILGVTLFGMEMKPLVIATGALLLVPCLMAYLSGRPMIGIFGRVMQWLGERTYSIYLWQQPFTLCNFLPNLLHPVGALMAVAVGGVWFHFFERPFLSTNRRK